MGSSPGQAFRGEGAGRRDTGLRDGGGPTPESPIAGHPAGFPEGDLSALLPAGPSPWGLVSLPSGPRALRHTRVPSLLGRGSAGCCLQGVLGTPRVWPGGFPANPIRAAPSASPGPGHGAQSPVVLGPHGVSSCPAPGAGGGPAWPVCSGSKGLGVQALRGHPCFRALRSVF